MKTIGLIGGMSWESSIEYYRLVNELVRERLGGMHSADCVMYSVDFAEIEPLQSQGKWDEAARVMIEVARRMEAAGADFLVLCTNTMHKVADDVERRIGIPLLHIADAAAEEVRARGLRSVGLLGTRFTMEQDFYRDRLADRHGLRVLVPNAEDRAEVDRVIYQELVVGRIREASRARYREVMQRLVADGARGIVLGCTEIGHLVGDEDASVPLLDTTRIHARAAVGYALGDE